MPLRKYSDDEKEVLASVNRVRREVMDRFGVKEPKDLTLEQAEVVADEIIKVPGYKDIIKGDIEAFQTLKEIKAEGRLN